LGIEPLFELSIFTAVNIAVRELKAMLLATLRDLKKRV
jgi:hypothetical protein